MIFMSIFLTINRWQLHKRPVNQLNSQPCDKHKLSLSSWSYPSEHPSQTVCSLFTFQSFIPVSPFHTDSLSYATLPNCVNPISAISDWHSLSLPFSFSLRTFPLDLWLLVHALHVSLLSLDVFSLSLSLSHTVRMIRIRMMLLFRSVADAQECVSFRSGSVTISVCLFSFLMSLDDNSIFLPFLSSISLSLS